MKPSDGAQPGALDAAWVRRIRVQTSLSAFGAGFVGLGAGLLVGRAMPALGLLLLGGGLLAHGVGMVGLHWTFGGHDRPRLWWWLEGAYWACWMVLLAVVGYLVWLTWP